MDTNNKTQKQEDSDKKLNIVKKVLWIIFCVIILALSCFIYANSKESKKSQTSMYETEQQQIAEMREYLNGIDESVSTNMEHLAQAAVLQTNTEETLKETANTLSGMEKQITEVEKVLAETITEKTDSSTETVTEKVDSAAETIKESVSNTQADLSRQIETANKDTQTMISDTQTQIDKVEKNLSSEITKNVDASTTMVINSMSAAKEELKQNIETAKSDISTILSDMNTENENNFQQTYEKMDNLQDTLDRVSLNLNTYYKDLAKLIRLFQQQNTEEHREILEALLKAQEELDKYLDESFEALNLRMDEDMADLMEELNVLHNQIAATQGELTDILNIMEENDSERQQEVREMFADTKNYLAFIEETFTDAHAKLQDIIIKFKEMEEANHAETLNVLQVMENDMQETTENGFQNLTETMNSFETSLNSTLDTMQENIFSSFSSTNSKMESSFQSMNENIENKFSETNGKMENNFQTANETLNQNFQDVKESLSQNFTDLDSSITNKNNEMVQNINSNIDEKVTNLTATINNYNESNGDNLEELKRYFNEQLQQFFTSVSNGKAELASALLTRGIDLGKEDATFEEICDGIMRSPSVDYFAEEKGITAATADNISKDKGAWVNGELIIGNGADNQAFYNQGYSDGLNKALNGARISYVYHQHTGNSTSGGGCYTVYRTSPGVSYNCGRVVGYSGEVPNLNWSIVCSYCSGAITNVWDAHLNELGMNVDQYAATLNHVGCPYATNGSSWYETGCGKTTSTIESATITFN